MAQLVRVLPGRLGRKGVGSCSNASSVFFTFFEQFTSLRIHFMTIEFRVFPPTMSVFLPKFEKFPDTGYTI